MKKMRLLLAFLLGFVGLFSEISWGAALAGPSHHRFNNYSFKYKAVALGRVLSANAEGSIKGIRAHDEYKEDESPHFAKVRIFYIKRAAAGGIPTLKMAADIFSHFYLSGWATAIADGYTVGSAYADIGLADLAANHHNRAKIGVVNIEEDWNLKGSPLKPDKDFPTQSYAHSEQAFTSHVLRAAGSVALSEDDDIEAVIIHIVGKSTPCPCCEPMLRRLISDGLYKQLLIKRLFPRLSDDQAGNINLYVVYRAFTEGLTGDFIDSSGIDIAADVYRKSLIEIRIGE